MFEKIWTIFNAVITLAVTALSVVLWFKKTKYDKLKKEACEIDCAEELERAEATIKNLESIVNLLQGLPLKINEVEDMLGSGNGSAKKHLVITDAYSECLLKGIDVDKTVIADTVENILSTPQKKTSNVLCEKNQINNGD